MLGVVLCVFYDSVQVNGYTFDLNRKEYDDKALLNTLKLFSFYTIYIQMKYYTIQMKSNSVTEAGFLQIILFLFEQYIHFLP